MRQDFRRLISADGGDAHLGSARGCGSWVRADADANAALELGVHGRAGDAYRACADARAPALHGDGCGHGARSGAARHRAPLS